MDGRKEGGRKEGREGGREGESIHNILWNIEYATCNKKKTRKHKRRKQRLPNL
jgi:hypothetical protein